MKTALFLTLSAALFVGACGTAPSDSVVPPDAATDALLPAEAPVPAETAPVAPPRQPAPVAAPPPRPAAPAAQAPAAPVATLPDTPRPVPVPARQAPPTFREFTIPAGTTLSLRLTTPVASDTSRVEDPIGATFAGPLMLDGASVIPAGTEVSGIVTVADGSARVKGRALLTLQFSRIQTGGDRYDMQTEPVSWLAPATKGEDAVKIGVGVGAGAVIGGILGGKGGAARGAAIGGAAGTGVVLVTKGEEVRLAAGTDVTTTLSAPLTIRLNVRP